MACSSGSLAWVDTTRRTGAWLHGRRTNLAPADIRGGAMVAPQLARLETHPRTPAALCEERLRIRHFQDLAHGLLPVGGALIVGLDDAITHPVGEVVALLQGAVVGPTGEIGPIDIGNECSLDLFLASLRQGGEVRVAGAAGSELSNQLGGA